MYLALNTFDWIELRTMPSWSTGSSSIEASSKLLIDRKCLKQEEIDRMFDEFTHIKSYLKGRQNVFDEWNEKNLPFVDRWMEIFAHMKQKSVPFGNFTKLIEYVLVMPGDKML